MQVNVNAKLVVSTHIKTNPIKETNSQNINFMGLKNSKTPSIFVFDLDGAFATANQAQLN